MPVDVNAYAKAIEASPDIDPAVKKKAIEIMRSLYQEEHESPDVQDPEMPGPRPLPGPVAPGVKCELCGKATVQLIPEATLAPCFTCGYINKLNP